MLRTSINLPIQLHHQLQFIAKGQAKSLSDVVRDILQKELGQQKARGMKRVYQFLAQVKGISQEPVTDVSATIDDRPVWAGGHMERQAWMTSKCSLTAMLSLACCLSKMLIMHRLSEFLTLSKRAHIPIATTSFVVADTATILRHASGQALARTLLDEVIAPSGFLVHLH